VEYQLKLKTSRAILSEINKRYPCMPFPLRKLLEQGSTSKLGLVECLQHGLLQSYPVLYEKEGVMVAQVKGTVLLLPNGSDRITSGQMQAVQSNIEMSVCIPLHD
jgi:methionine aminopeptidase